MSFFLLWLLRLVVILLIVVTLAPLLPLGAWYIRAWDFPRLQLAALLAVCLSVVLIVAMTTTWRFEYTTYLLILFAAMIWQVSHVLPFTSIWSKQVPTYTGNESTPIRFLVVNLKVVNPHKSEVAEKIRELNADIVLLIEIDEAWADALQNIASDYYHVVRADADKGLGMSLWSQHPVQHEDLRYLVSRERVSIYCEIELPGGQIFHFVGVHPTPPGLEDHTPGGRRDSRVRDAELIMVAKEVANKPDAAWVVAGDFNDVAWSHTTRLYKRISGLKDPRIGRGLYNTYHAQYPLLRYPVDHVFTSSHFHVIKLQRARIPGSDHFAVITDLVYVEKTSNGPNPTSDDLEEAVDLIQEGKTDAEQRNVQSTKSHPAME